MSIKWFLGWIWAFPFFQILTGIQITGTIPKKGPCILACNHMSFLDPPIVGITAFREVYFLAKIGLFRLSSAFTWLIKTFNAIPITNIQGLRTGMKLLKAGRVLVIFPEGTRSRIGTMLPFNPGVSYLAINLKIPVIPVYIANSDKNFLSLIMRIHQLRITFGRPIYPDGFHKKQEDFEKFALFLREEVLKLR